MPRYPISILAALALTASALSVGCDQQVDEGEDKLAEGNQSLEVVYGNSTETVFFENLETLSMFNDAPVVRLTDVVEGSGLIISAAGLWFDFVGSDGYSPLDNPNCDAAFTPASSELLAGGYLERGTRRLLWEESLDVPQCMSVKDVETIHVGDTPEDLPGGGDADTDADSDADSDPSSGVVTVDWDGASEDVDLAELETTPIGEASVVLLTTIFGQTSFVFEPSEVLLSLEGSDGYNPVDEGTCTEALPAPGDLSDQGGIDPLTNDIEWDPALDFPGCAFVKEVATIYVLPS